MPPALLSTGNHESAGGVVRCPWCNQPTEIYQTRTYPTVVWRRRRCKVCKRTFRTTESAISVPPATNSLKPSPKG